MLHPSTDQPANFGKQCEGSSGLPCRLGGTGLSNPATRAEHNQNASKRVCQPLIDRIMQQEGDVMEAKSKQQNFKRTIRKKRQNILKEEAEQTISLLAPAQHCCAKAGQQAGTSTWLTAVPLERLGFRLHKGEFRDACLCTKDGVSE